MADEPRRYLLAVGVEHYKDSKEWGRLSQVPREIEQIVQLLTSRSFGMTRILEGASAEPDTNALLSKLASWAVNPERSETDQLILYWTGHGENPAENLKLILENTSAQARLPVIAAQDLVEAVLSPYSRISAALFILDVCFAGQAGLDMASRIGSLVRGRPARRHPHVAIISATSSRALAGQSWFATAFVEALVQCAELRELSPANICRRINERMPAEQRASFASIGSGDIAFFPSIPASEISRRQAETHTAALAAACREAAREQFGSIERTICEDELEGRWVTCQLTLVPSEDRTASSTPVYVCSDLMAGGEKLTLNEVIEIRGRLDKRWRLPKRNEIVAVVDPQGVCSDGAN